jgi:hypothetical protein
MASRDQIIQRLARIYREEHGVADIDPLAFAAYLLENGVRPPPAPTPLELMAKAAKRALKQEVRRDDVTGRPYHGWQAVPQSDPATGQLKFSYFDTDDAPREPMLKALVIRVGQMIDDGVQVTFDAEHWNRVNPQEAPLEVEEMMDLREQVQWRIAARDQGVDDDGDGGEGGDPDPASPR